MEPDKNRISSQLTTIRQTITTALCCVALLTGCSVGPRPVARAPEDFHTYKTGRSYPGTIADPAAWALAQFANGPVSGPNVSDYAKIVIAHGLSYSLADLNGDGNQVLFLRYNDAARVRGVMAFLPVKGGYRYIGEFEASAVTIIKPGSIRVYEACGGHFGYIKTYKSNGDRFTCVSTEPIATGDGAPDADAMKMERLFPEQGLLAWSNDDSPAQP